VVPYAPQPVWLAQTLLFSRGILSCHDRAALSFVVTPPAVRMHASDAVTSGPQSLDYFAPKSWAAGCWSHFERDPPVCMTF
jgi:hypothetical protein